MKIKQDADKNSTTGVCTACFISNHLMTLLGDFFHKVLPPTFVLKALSAIVCSCLARCNFRSFRHSTERKEKEKAFELYICTVALLLRWMDKHACFSASFSRKTLHSSTTDLLSKGPVLNIGFLWRKNFSSGVASPVNVSVSLKSRLCHQQVILKFTAHRYKFYCRSYSMRGNFQSD